MARDSDSRCKTMNWLLSIWRKWLQQKSEVITKKDLHLVDLPNLGEVAVSHTADCLGAACPRPQLITMQLLEKMESGDVLEVVSDNPTTVETIPALAMVLYSKHLATLHTDNDWRIYILKGEDGSVGQ